MKLHTTRTKIRGVAEAWREQYRDYRAGDVAGKAAIGAALAALDPEKATAADVERIVGNTSWTALTCDACQVDVPAAVEIIEDSEYEGPHALLCSRCLRAALSLIAPKRRRSRDRRP